MTGKHSALLSCVFGHYAGMDFPVDGKGLIIGRDPTLSHIVIDHPSVSRSHARLHLSREGGLFLEDMASSNGTYVLVSDGLWGRLAGIRRVKCGDRFSLLSEDGVEIAIFEVGLHADDSSELDAFKRSARPRNRRDSANNFIEKLRKAPVNPSSSPSPASEDATMRARHAAYRMKKMVGEIGSKTAGIDKDSVSAYERLVSVAIDAENFEKTGRIGNPVDEKDRTPLATSFMITLGFLAGLPISYYVQPDILRDRLSLWKYVLYIPTIIGLSHSRAIMLTTLVTCIICGCSLGLLWIALRKKFTRR